MVMADLATLGEPIKTRREMRRQFIKKHLKLSTSNYLKMDNLNARTWNLADYFTLDGGKWVNRRQEVPVFFSKRGHVLVVSTVDTVLDSFNLVTQPEQLKCFFQNKILIIVTFFKNSFTKSKIVFMSLRECNECVTFLLKFLRVMCINKQKQYDFQYREWLEHRNIYLRALKNK